ncbi:MAG: uracil phosphoribosyltransferase [Candidatus Dormibacteria bacterium]
MSTNLTVVDHPAVAHRLTELRDERTGRDRFRILIGEISAFLAYHALADLETAVREFRTPVGATQGPVITEEPLVVPILRAGLGMVPGVAAVAPNCEVAHLGMKRDEQTLDAVCYLDGLPANLRARRVVVCDPMLATGGSLAQACQLLLARGAARVQALCILASEPGLRTFSARLPEVEVFCAAIDPSLDSRGYIVPGLGDAGDRLFGPPGAGLSTAQQVMRLEPLSKGAPRKLP